MTTEQNLKIKLTLGYILLIAIFSFSIVYILKEVENLNVPKDDILIENTKVIQLGNIMSDLYATENTGRLALLSYDNKYAKLYHKQLDSLLIDIQKLKNNNISNNIIKQKLDSIIYIVKLKSLTFDQVLDVREHYAKYNIYNEAQNKLRIVQNKASNTKIAVDTVVNKPSLVDRIFSNRTKQQEERLKKENEKILTQQKELQSEITRETESILKTAKAKELKYFKEYYSKESLLIDRNKELSLQLRNVLIQVEKIILENSKAKYNLNKNVIDKVSYNIAIVGILTSLVALVFGFVILRDLNKSNRNKLQLQTLNRTMADLAKQKSFFMATISHDMVSPLNSLIGFSTLLKNTLRTPKQKEYLDNMQQSTKYIKNMVDDLSLFSNLEYNKIKLKNGRFNFASLVTNVVNNLKNSAKRKNIELNLNLDEELNKDFNSDSYRIQQILTNVISNAIKFTHKGSVRIDARKMGDKVAIKIIDTGIGMDIANKDDLFVEFVQVHTTTDNKYGGSGLGLNITKRLIELLNGSISFESELGKGTTFSIELPLELFKVQNETIIEEEYEYDNEKKLQNKKILVIDDDPLQLKLLQEILYNKVKLITTIENGKDAKKILEQEQYNLIITDMQMPHYSGLKVIEDIRSLTNYKYTPVIALTGKIDFDEQEYKKLGFNIYMRKPLNINKLYNVIYKLLRIKARPTDILTSNFKPTDTIENMYFDLTDFKNLLEHDTEAIKQIIDSFVNNAEKDLELLKTAGSENRIDDVKNITHKMLPMFRQLKMEQCIQPLEILERDASNLSQEQIQLKIEDVLQFIKISFQELKKTTLK